jgi:integrase
MARRSGKDRGLLERPLGSGIWWIRYADSAGREHREKVGPKGVARRLYEKRKTDVREGRFFPSERRRAILVREILDDYRRYAENSGKKIESNWGSYKRLYAAFGDIMVNSLLPTQIEEFRDDLGKTLKPASVNCHLQILRAAFNRALRAEKISRYPFRQIKMLKPNNIRVRYLSDEEEERLLFSLPEYLRPLVRVAIHTGLRRGELLSLHWDALDLASRILHVKRSKSGEGRRIPLDSLAAKILTRLRQERSLAAAEPSTINSQYVFCAPRGGFLQNLQREWAPAVRKAGLEDFCFHDLRHTFASRLVMAGVDLYTVQTLLGHKSAAMVQRYAHLSPEHLRKAVEKLVTPINTKAQSVNEKTGAGFGAG